MTREEAIEVLENGGWWDLLIPITTIEGRIEEDKLHEALDLALTALRPVSREQVERRAGEWVQEPNKGPAVFYCSSCGENFEIHSYEFQKYRFCPFCMAPMTDEAVQMVVHAPTITPLNEALTMEQLREMKDKPAYLKVFDPLLQSGWHIIKAVTEDKIIFRGWHTVYVPISGMGVDYNLYRRPPEGADAHPD